MLELALLLVELVLLIATVILLVLSRREWRGREELLNLLMVTTRVLTRQEYFNMVIETIHSAKRSIYAIVTGTKPSERSESFVENVLKAMAEAHRRGVSLNYLLPKSPERLKMGYEYSRAGADVKYHDGLVVHDFRFMVVDEECVVIGLPEKAGERQPTRRGVLVRSKTLARVLIEYFNRFWTSAESYQSYFAKTVEKLKAANPELPAESILRQLDLGMEAAG